MRQYRSSCSAKDLVFGGKSPNSLFNCDPFEKMKLKKNNPAILRPICHRRLTSERAPAKVGTGRNQQGLDNRVLLSPQSLQSPRLSPESFLKLNPSFRNQKFRIPSRVIDLKIPRLVRNEVNSECLQYCKVLDGGLIGIHKGSFQGNFLVRKMDCVNKDLEFSFGKN